MALDRLTKVDGGGISTTSDYRVGVITATKFVGPIDGVVTGTLTGTATTAVNAQGLIGTPDIVVGIITASSANFSGNVSIGGTLTYEDVTNIDSVGIITARDGIKVGTGITIGPAGVGTFTSVHAIDSFACQKYPTTKISFPTNSDHLQIFTSNTQRMRFYAAGTIFIGEESQGPSGNAGLYLNRSSTSVFSDSSRLYDQPNYAMVHIKNYNATGGGEAGIVLHNDNGAAGVVAIYGKKRSNYISDCIFRFRDAGNTSVESFRVRTTDIQVGTGVTIETNGQATFVGIVTFGSGSTTIDNNVVNVGTALTLGHTQGVQFHTQNLHSQGFEVNQINASGIITASSFRGPTGGTATFQDIDVDGHTNLDNVSIAGVTTMGQTTIAHTSSPQLIIKDSDTTGAADSNGISFQDASNTQYGFIGQTSSGGHTMLITTTNTVNPIRLQVNSSTKLEVGNTGCYVQNGNFYVLDSGSSNLTGDVNINSNAPTLNFNDSNGNPDYRVLVNAGVFKITDTTNSVDRISIASNGNVSITNDLDVDGHTNLDNVSIAGVTTFAQKINLSDNFIRNCRGFNTGNEQARIVVKAGDNSAGGGLRIVEYYNDDTTLFSSEIANFYTTEIELKENVSITGDLTITGTGEYLLQLNKSDSSAVYTQFTNSTTGTSTSDGFRIGIDSNEDGLVWLREDGNVKFGTSNEERLRIDSSGHLHTGYTSGFGADHVNILASDGGGVSIAQNNAGNATSGTVLGSLSIQGYHNTATHLNAEVKISGIAAANHTGSSAATDMVFYTKPSTTGPGSSPTERLRITSGGVVKIGGDVSNSSSDVGTVTKLTIKQHTNTHEGGMYIERSGERRGWYMYVGGAGGYNDALCLTTNQMGTDTNVLAIDRGNRLAKLGGDVIIDSTNNGYGGLRIYDDTSGGYNVNYVGGRNDGNMSHVFKSGGRSQNQSPWTDASGSEIMRVSLSNGLQLFGDTDSALQYHTGDHYKFKTKGRDRVHLDNRGVFTAPKLSTKALAFSSCNNKWGSSRSIMNFVMEFYTGASSATYHFMRMISQPDWGYDDVQITQYRYQYNPSGSDHTVRRYYTYYGSHSEQIVRYNQQGSGTGTGNDNYISKRTDFGPGGSFTVHQASNGGYYRDAYGSDYTIGLGAYYGVRLEIKITSTIGTYDTGDYPTAYDFYPANYGAQATQSNADNWGGPRGVWFNTTSNGTGTGTAPVVSTKNADRGWSTGSNFLDTSA